MDIRQVIKASYAGFSIYKAGLMGGEMAQEMKVLANQPDDMSLTLRIHMVEGENERPLVVF